MTNNNETLRESFIRSQTKGFIYTVVQPDGHSHYCDHCAHRHDPADGGVLAIRHTPTTPAMLIFGVHISYCKDCVGKPERIHKF